MKRILYVLLLIPFTLTGQRYVSGYVFDADNDNQPVVGAPVFISNSTIGDFTDTEGFYKLRIPTEGSYQLTISHVGYKLFSKDIESGNKSVVLNVSLQMNELQEVTITEKVKFRRSDINIFWNTILGTNPSSKKIQVINPEEVYYYYNSKTRILTVTCREPLQIINHETGYEIRYVLDYFTHDYNKNLSDWSNQIVFTELIPESIKQKNKWDKKRREVYSLSLVKFIKSLYNNSLHDDGFILVTLDLNPSSDQLLNISILNTEDILSTNSTNGIKTLNSSDKQVFLVCYGRPVTSNDLFRIQQTQSKSFYKNHGLLMNMIYGNSVRIFPDGTYANKIQMAAVNLSNTLLGLNLRLPVDYDPEKIELPATEEEILDFRSITSHFDAQIHEFPQERIHLHTDRNFYVPGEKIWFKAYLTDAATLQPSTKSRYVYVELINSSDSLIDRVMIRPENDIYHGHLFLSENYPEGYYTLRAYTRYMENLGDDYFFKKNIYIANIASDKNIPSLIGNGSKITQIATEDFKTNTDTYSLIVSRQDEKLTIGVWKPDNYPDIDCYLLAHCRGQVFYFSDLQGMADQVEFVEEDLPEGVLQFVLFDEKMNPLSERFVFNKNNNPFELVFHTDKEIYEKREKVTATLSLTDSDGNALNGDFSISVTDDGDITADSTTTIQSSLLLSSELKGFIENPAYYLQDNNESAIALNNLMQTYGWERYNIPEVVKGKYKSPNIQFQTSQEISGKVQSNGRRPKPVSGSEVSFMAKGGEFKAKTTDKNGLFKFDNFEHPDSTFYYVQALGKKGSKNVELVLDSEQFPPSIHAPQSPITKVSVIKEETKSESEPNAFIAKADLRSKYDEEMRMIQLSEVVITGQRPKKREEARDQFYLNAVSDVTIRRDDITKMQPRLVSDILQRVAGVRVASDGYIFIGGPVSINHQPKPLVLIDGVQIGWGDWESAMGGANVDPEGNAPTERRRPELSPLETVKVHEVESIDVFKSGFSTAIFGMRGAGGVISITTRRGIDVIREKESKSGKEESTNSTIYAPLGYQRPVDFYSPKYETSEAKNSTIPDYRTTIFWKPDIIISDTGKASFDFYTSDFPTTYSVVIEGITKDGKIVRQVEKIVVSFE